MLAAVLEDKYELIRLLGEGGMGAVYEARHLQIGRHVAIKLMGEAVAQSEEARRRFLREAQVAGTLDHENICPVTDLGETSEGVPYLVMPLLKGHSLAEELVSRQGPLPVARSVDIVCQVLTGLEVAHAAHVLHRDLKPDNIFLVQRPGKSDLVKLVDFGISKIIGPVGASTELTGTGMVVGTPAYLSPEQAMATGVMDQRVDVYGAAVVLYQLLTGRRPFEARSYNEMIVKICTEPFALPHTLNGVLDPALEAVLLRGMAREPEQRWSTAHAFRQALAQLPLALADQQVRNLSTQVLATGRAPGAATSPTHQVAVALTVPQEQSADRIGLVQTPTGAGQADSRVAAAAIAASGAAAGVDPGANAAANAAAPSDGIADAPRDRRRGGLWGGLMALVGVVAGAGVVLAYLSFRPEPAQPRRGGGSSVATSPPSVTRPEVTTEARPDPLPARPPLMRDAATLRRRVAVVGPAMAAVMQRTGQRNGSVRVRPRPRIRPSVRPRPRPLPRQQSSVEPSGGTTAYLATVIGGKVYSISYVRSQGRRLKSRINRCYAAARFNGVHHEFAMWALQVSAKGNLVAAKLSGSKPVGKGLNACVIRALRSISWNAPDNGQGGWFRMGYTARIRRR